MSVAIVKASFICGTEKKIFFAPELESKQNPYWASSEGREKLEENNKK